MVNCGDGVFIERKKCFASGLKNKKKVLPSLPTKFKCVDPINKNTSAHFLNILQEIRYGGPAMFIRFMAWVLTWLKTSQSSCSLVMFEVQLQRATHVKIIKCHKFLWLNSSVFYQYCQCNHIILSSEQESIMNLCTKTLYV